jgi:hypothetical protein
LQIIDHKPIRPFVEDVRVRKQVDLLEHAILEELKIVSRQIRDEIPQSSVTTASTST